jgi:hypothetical protein
MLKLTLQKIWQANAPNRQGVSSLGKLITQDLPIKSSYWINKQVRKLEKETEEINVQHKKLVEKYGEKQKDGNLQVSQFSPKFQAFQKEFNKFLETEVELEIQPIKFEYFEEAKLSPADFINLDWLIEPPVEKK